MRKAASVLLVASCACAGTRAARGPAVDVYQAEAAAAPGTRKLPEGCRLLGRAGPIDQMESERAADDPYKVERRKVAEEGGNVLLVLSHRTVTRPNTDCPSGDASPDCLRKSQSWFRVAFEEYACDTEAAAALKALPPAPPSGGITLVLGGAKKSSPQPPPAAPSASPAPAAVTVAELKGKVLEMMREKVAPDVVLAYVRGQRLSRKMTAEEIIDWTRSGVPDAVIEAAASR